MTLTAKDIAAKLAARVESFCRDWLPHGKVDSGNWRVGSLAGEKGSSLGVQLTGPRAGLWADFAGTDSGDLLDLIAAIKGVPLREAIKLAKDWLGIHDPVAANQIKPTYKRPNLLGVVSTKTVPDTDVERYLKQERKLTRETLEAYRIGQFDHPGIGRSVAYPSFQDGQIVAMKYIALARDEHGKKRIIGATSDQAPALFGWQAFPVGSRVALICEGQIDCMTWNQWGVPALSVPNGCAGGGHDTWIDYEWDALCQFDTIYISFDMDPDGEKSVPILARRLGIHRCLIVKLPYNDANECLQRGCTGEDAARWMREAKPMAPGEIKTPKDFREKIIERNNPDPNKPKPGLEFPVLGKRIRFLPGEVTIWTGYSFHGKSTLLNQLALAAAMEGQGVAIGSFEMRGELTCEKLSRCLAFKADVIPILDDCLNWMTGKIWIYDIVDIVTQEKVFALMLYSVMRHGVKHIIIDSLMKCDVSSEDYEGQRVFLNKLIAFCNEHEVHGHIVAHPRKAEDDSKIPDVMDIHGGQSVSGQPANIITVWKNSKKADKREDGKLKNGEEHEIPDAFAYIRKNRSLQDRYSVGLWFHRGCNRFTATKSANQPYFEDFGIIKPPPEIAEGI